VNNVEPASIAYLASDISEYEPVEISKFLKRGKRAKSSIFPIVRKAKHPMLADGYALKSGEKGQIIPVSFNADAQIRILRHKILGVK
jgi:hypothetical protein